VCVCVCVRARARARASIFVFEIYGTENSERHKFKLCSLSPTYSQNPNHILPTYQTEILISVMDFSVNINKFGKLKGVNTKLAGKWDVKLWSPL
jgi:hypothetical protein